MIDSLPGQAAMTGAPAAASDALANVIGLARLSRLTLLYHGTDGGPGRPQPDALARAAAAARADDIVVVFDAGSELPVPDLLAAIEAAVLEAAPHAPLAPPMAGPVDALSFWQQALGIRFLLVVHRFDLALASPDPAFNAVLLKLAHDPLDISMLLVMDEAAAPLMQGLREMLPELGETFLRLPETGGAPPPAETAGAADATEATGAATRAADTAALPDPAAAPAFAPAQFGPSPFLFDDPVADLAADRAQVHDGQTDVTLPQPAADSPQETEDDGAVQRRSRRFSALLEQAGAAPEALGAPAAPAPDPLATAAPPTTETTVPAPIYPAAAPAAPMMPAAPLADGRAEPAFLAAPPPPPSSPSATARLYRERRPMQVAAWMQKRRARRRRRTVDIASRVGSSSTVLFVLMLLLGVLGWQMPQLAASAGATGRNAMAVVAQQSQIVAVRGNRYRLSISTATSSAGTGRDTR